MGLPLESKIVGLLPEMSIISIKVDKSILFHEWTIVKSLSNKNFFMDLPLDLPRMVITIIHIGVDNVSYVHMKQMIQSFFPQGYETHANGWWMRFNFQDKNIGPIPSHPIPCSWDKDLSL